MKDSRIRSFVKGISWRFIATATTMGIVFVLTGDLEIVAVAGTLDVVVKLLFYYAHERAWGRVVWGRAVVPVRK